MMQGRPRLSILSNIARKAQQKLAAHAQGGFYVWLTLPGGVDTVALSAAARDLKVAYVPGRPFYAGGGGASQIRLSYSRVADDLIDEGIRRIAAVARAALDHPAA